MEADRQRPFALRALVSDLVCPTVRVLNGPDRQDRMRLDPALFPKVELEMVVVDLERPIRVSGILGRPKAHELCGRGIQHSEILTGAIVVDDDLQSKRGDRRDRDQEHGLEPRTTEAGGLAQKSDTLPTKRPSLARMMSSRLTGMVRLSADSPSGPLL